MKKFLLPLILAASAVSLSGCGETVDQGNRGVFSTFGEIDPKSYPEGFYWYNPFTTSLDEYNARSSKYEHTTSTNTKDQQRTTITYAVVWRPVADNIPKLIKNIGPGYPNTLIPPVVLSAIKNEFGKITAPEAVSKRGAIEGQIFENVQTLLAKKNIVIEGFNIVDVSFEPEYQQAIEAKANAVQNAEAEVNRTVQVREKAAQKVINAEAESQEIKLRAQALEANPALVNYEWVRKWNGQMPSTVYCSAATPCVGGMSK